MFKGNRFRFIYKYVILIFNGNGVRFIVQCTNTRMQRAMEKGYEICNYGR